MEMVTCELCNKPFATAGPRICVRCLKRLDAVYMKARDYIRENPKERLSISELAEVIQEDVRDLEVLVQQGRLDRDAGTAVEESEGEDSRRKKLLESIQKSMAENPGEKKAYRSYGEERYSKR